jgi:hypothetical protein
MLSVGLLLLLELLVRKASSLYLFSSENSFSSQNKWLKLTNYFLFFSREMFESDINVIGNSGANLHINDVSNFFWYILSIFFLFHATWFCTLTNSSHSMWEKKKKWNVFSFSWFLSSSFSYAPKAQIPTYIFSFLFFPFKFFSSPVMMQPDTKWCQKIVL